MIAHKHLLQCQKVLNQDFQRSATLYLGALPPHLKNYSVAYHKELKGCSKISNKSKLLSESLKSQIILCGDYHTLSQAQRTVIRILRDILPLLKKKKKTVYLALEILRASDAIRVQQFIGNQLKEDEFLKKISFKSWGLNWQNYAPLFDLAKEHEIPVLGLSPSKSLSLRARDLFAAGVLANWSEKNPDALILALMGDLHCAEKHLPNDLKKELSAKNLQRKILVIHQNHDEIYWNLAKKKKETTAEVVQLKKGVFCVLNTPPWIKLQSNLNWWVNHQEDFSQDILNLAQGIASFLGVSLSRSFFEGGHFHFYKNSEISMAPREVKRFKNLFFYDTQSFYFSEFNLNHLAAFSAQYLHSKLSPFQKRFQNPRSDFYPFVWVEALGFLGSKMINPKRKCLGAKDILRAKEGPLKLAKLHLIEEYKSFREHRLFQNPFLKGEHVLKSKEILDLYEASKILGKLLGHGIFELILRDKVRISSVRKLFETDFDNQSESLYLEWVGRLEASDLRNFSSRERL